jgi:hypothetical protein
MEWLSKKGGAISEPEIRKSNAFRQNNLVPKISNDSAHLPYELPEALPIALTAEILKAGIEI